MFNRLTSVFLIIFAVLLFGLFQRSFEYYNGMQLFMADGKPHLLLQKVGSDGDGNNDRFFSIYVPRDKHLDDWECVVPDFYGPVIGNFQSPSRPVEPAGIWPELLGVPNDVTAPVPQVVVAQPSTNYLGMLHLTHRATLFDLSRKPISSDYKSLPLPFDWAPETAVEVGGVTYLFGTDFSDSTTKKLKVAQFDGNEARQMPALGPTVAPVAFSLQAVVVNDCVCVIWREYEDDSSIGIMEGERFVTAGPLKMAVYYPQVDAFSKTEFQIDGLPRGNMTTWSDGGKIKVLVQTRSHSDQANKSRGAMEIWELGDWETAKDATLTSSLVESITPAGKPKFFPFIAAEHVTWNGEEYILRSNWQNFELWKKPPNENWTLALKNPAGLPVYDLESKFFTALALCIALTVFGGGLAYKRRQHAWSVVKQLQPADVYATLGARMGAYMLDLIVVFAATFAVARALGQINIMPYEMLTSLNFALPIHRPFLAVYLLYFTLCEWLTGRTLGKFAMGLCVVSEGSSKISLWAAFLRNVVGLYERLPFILMVPMIMMFLGPRRQRMGDLFARTFVVYKGAWEILMTQARNAPGAGQKEKQA